MYPETGDSKSAKQRREGKEQHVRNPEDRQHGGKSSVAGQEREEGVRAWGWRADERQRGAVTEGGGDVQESQLLHQT